MSYGMQAFLTSPMQSIQVISKPIIMPKTLHTQMTGLFSFKNTQLSI